MSGGLSVWNTSPTSARTAAISHSTMQWDDVVKKAASAKKKGALHVDMVNILWIKRKNHLHFAMQMVKSVEVAGFEPAAFWSRTKRATKLRYAPNGANEEIRTLDLRITSALLCQLSYIGLRHYADN